MTSDLKDALSQSLPTGRRVPRHARRFRMKDSRSKPYECRSGICGQCKTKLVSGRVVMESQDALTASDRANGVVLACQARPVGDVVVDA